MDVILLQKVKNLGNLGDRVKVKPGYSRNFLIPPILKSKILIQASTKNGGITEVRHLIS